jgi:hypothetical protein
MPLSRVRERCWLPTESHHADAVHALVADSPWLPTALWEVGIPCGEGYTAGLETHER